VELSADGSVLIAEYACRANPAPVLGKVMASEAETREHCKRGRTWEGHGGSGERMSDGRALLTGSHDEQCEGLKILARLVGTSGERPPKADQSGTDRRCTWSTAKRGERRVWEVETRKPNPLARGDVNQLLGQIEVETRRAAKTQVYGCLLTPGTTVKTTRAKLPVTGSR
jgi:hypothetical protein